MCGDVSIMPELRVGEQRWTVPAASNLLDALNEWRPSVAPKWVDRAPV